MDAGVHGKQTQEDEKVEMSGGFSYLRNLLNIMSMNEIMVKQNQIKWKTWKFKNHIKKKHPMCKIFHMHTNFGGKLIYLDLSLICSEDIHIMTKKNVNQLSLGCSLCSVDWHL